MYANKHFSGSFVVLISFRKSVISLRNMYEGIFLRVVETMYYPQIGICIQ